jgi:hypothetical protein
MKKALLVMFENNIIFKRMRQHKFLLIIALCTSIVLSCSSDHGGSGGGNRTNGETLRFVFLADSRSASYGGDPVVPENFINTPVLNAIVTQILALSPRPAFVVFGGDMAYRGHYQHSTTSFYTFQAFKNVMAPLTDAGIPVYTTMGNHELYDTHAGTFVFANQTEFQAVFSDNPSNGPPSYERLVYSFTSPGGDAFFAVLDPYYITADTPVTDLNGNIDDTQLSWLAAQVAQTSATHKFFFIHTPYYYVSGTTGNASFTSLWTILDKNQFDLYACGHSHLYSRKTIDSNIDPGWKNNVVQLLTGTCGAVLDTTAPVVDPTLWHVFNGLNAPNTYYFSVVDINGAQTTVNSYGGNTGAYSIIDTFTIQKNTSPQVVSQRSKGDKLAMFFSR